MSFPVRNLIYHVCPLAKNDLWRTNVEHLRRRMHVFTGRRVIAIATGDGLQPPEVAEQALASDGCEFLRLPNCRLLREVATFGPLLEAIADPSPDQVAFYGHTKGNSTACNVLGATRWRNAMYHHLLDRWQDSLAELARPGTAAVGTHKMVWPRGARPPFPTRLRHANWIFAGTFFWFRHDRVFTHDRWPDVPRDRYGAEAWLGGLFGPAEGTSVFQPWPETRYPTPNPYDPSLYSTDFDD